MNRDNIRKHKLLFRKDGVTSQIVDYYNRFGQNRDLEQYLTFSNPNASRRCPSIDSEATSNFASARCLITDGENHSDCSRRERAEQNKMDSDSDDSRVTKYQMKPFEPVYYNPNKASTSGNKDIIKTKGISIKFDSKTKLAIEDSDGKSDESSQEGVGKSRDDAPQNLDSSLNKAGSPTSSITSRRLEWDSLADVGYANVGQNEHPHRNLSTLERMALDSHLKSGNNTRKYDSKADTQSTREETSSQLPNFSQVGLPNAQSTPILPSQAKSPVVSVKRKSILRTTPRRDSSTESKSDRRVTSKDRHKKTLTSSLNSGNFKVDLTKHFSFNVDIRKDEDGQRKCRSDGSIKYDQADYMPVNDKENHKGDCLKKDDFEFRKPLTKEFADNIADGSSKSTALDVTPTSDKEIQTSSRKNISTSAQTSSRLLKSEEEQGGYQPISNILAKGPIILNVLRSGARPVYRTKKKRSFTQPLNVISSNVTHESIESEHNEEIIEENAVNLDATSPLVAEQEDSPVKCGESLLSRAESFEYMPGHMYQNNSPPLLEDIPDAEKSLPESSLCAVSPESVADDSSTPGRSGSSLSEPSKSKSELIYEQYLIEKKREDDQKRQMALKKWTLVQEMQQKKQSSRKYAETSVKESTSSGDNSIIETRRQLTLINNEIEQLSLLKLQLENKRNDTGDYTEPKSSNRHKKSLPKEQPEKHQTFDAYTVSVSSKTPNVESGKRNVHIPLLNLKKSSEDSSMNTLSNAEELSLESAPNRHAKTPTAHLEDTRDLKSDVSSKRENAKVKEEDAEDEKKSVIGDDLFSKQFGILCMCCRNNLFTSGSSSEGNKDSTKIRNISLNAHLRKLDKVYNKYQKCKVAKSFMKDYDELISKHQKTEEKKTAGPHSCRCTPNVGQKEGKVLTVENVEKIGETYLTKLNERLKQFNEDIAEDESKIKLVSGFEDDKGDRPKSAPLPNSGLSRRKEQTGIAVSENIANTERSQRSNITKGKSLNSVEESGVSSKLGNTKAEEDVTSENKSIKGDSLFQNQFGVLCMCCRSNLFTSGSSSEGNKDSTKIRDISPNSHLRKLDKVYNKYQKCKVMKSFMKDYDELVLKYRKIKENKSAGSGSCRRTSDVGKKEEEVLTVENVKNIGNAYLVKLNERLRQFNKGITEDESKIKLVTVRPKSAPLFNSGVLKEQTGTKVSENIANTKCSQSANATRRKSFISVEESPKKDTNRSKSNRSDAKISEKSVEKIQESLPKTILVDATTSPMVSQSVKFDVLKSDTAKSDVNLSDNFISKVKKVVEQDYDDLAKKVNRLMTSVEHLNKERLENRPVIVTNDGKEFSKNIERPTQRKKKIIPRENDELRNSISDDRVFRRAKKCTCHLAGYEKENVLNDGKGLKCRCKAKERIKVNVPQYCLCQKTDVRVDPHVCSCRERTERQKYISKLIEQAKKSIVIPKPIAYNLILQPSDSVLEETIKDIKRQSLEDVIVKVPRRLKGGKHYKDDLRDFNLASGSTYNGGEEKGSTDEQIKEFSSLNDEFSDTSSVAGYASERSVMVNSGGTYAGKENQAKKHSMTVEEYLRVNRPGFVNEADKRREYLRKLHVLREQKDIQRRKVLALGVSNLPNIKNISTSDLHQLADQYGIITFSHKGKNKIFNSQDMVRSTTRLYTKLPEVQNKKLDLKKLQLKKTNFLMADLFSKKLREKALKGLVNISHSSSVVTI